MLSNILFFGGATTPQTQTGLSRIRVTTPQTQTGVSNIRATTPERTPFRKTLTPRIQIGISHINQRTAHTIAGKCYISSIKLRSSTIFTDSSSTTTWTAGSVTVYSTSTLNVGDIIKKVKNNDKLIITIFGGVCCSPSA